MKLHKYISVILVFAMILTLTACGKTTTETTSTDYHGEGQVQGGIKSDEEIAALQEEERAGTTDAQQPTTEDGTENNQQSDDSDATPATSGTGNAEDYWDGSYFNIISYLNDNGADDAYWTDIALDRTDSDIHACVATFYNKKWHIIVYDNAIVLTHIFFNSEGVQTFDPWYNILYDPEECGNLVVINNNTGFQTREKTLETLFTVVECIQANPNSDDPLSSSGLMYSNSPQ